MTYQIKHLRGDWYDFSKVPQGYIKIHALNCGEKRILKVLKRITGEQKPAYEVIKNKPEYGKVYALTGATGTKCIANGNTWAESVVSSK